MNLRRVAIPTAITAFWLVMMALLLRDHVLPRRGISNALEVDPDSLTEEWRDYEEWMRLTIARHSNGLSYTNIRRQPDKGYLACNRTWLDLELLGARHTFRLQTVASLDSSFQLQRASVEVRLDDSQMSFVALSTASRLLYRWEYEGQTKSGSMPLERPISMLEAARPMLARRLELKVGTAYRLPVLDSTWSLRQGWVDVKIEAEERIRIGPRTFEAYRLVMMLGPFASTTWVSPQGEVLRREFAGNIVMERMEPERARERFPGIDAPATVPPVQLSDFAGAEGQERPPEETIAPFSLLLELFRQPAK